MSSYTGRLGDICDSIRLRFNDSGSFASEAVLLGLVNECQKDLARNRVYRGRATIDVVTGQADYDLATLVPDFVELDQVYDASTGDKLTKLYAPEDQEPEIARALSAKVRGYSITGQTLALYPTPAASRTGGIVLRYFYMPTPLTGLTASDAVGEPGDPDYEAAVPDGTTPQRLTAAQDEIFVLFALMRLYERDRASATNPQMLQMKQGQYELAKRSLLSVDNRDGRRRPARW